MNEQPNGLGGPSFEDVIYLDHAATTPVDPAVLESMLPYLTNAYGNPSSLHTLGRQARAGVDWARGTIAKALNCHAREIVFTSGATESDNLAIRGIVGQRLLDDPATTPHIITTAIEHHAVLHAAESLQRHGVECTFLPVGGDGIVDVAEIERAIQPNTCLISIMYANNEVGSIQPVGEIAALAHRHNIPFHTDAVQAAGALSLDTQELGIDMLSLSAHKFYAPKGVGLLFVREGLRLDWQMSGGEQELTRRAGTENVAGIVGMATALALAVEQREEHSTHAASLRDQLMEGLLERCPGAVVNGSLTQRLPNNLSIAFPNVDGESLLVDLDLSGVAVSSGSACASGRNEPSHVLGAIGLPNELAEGTLRMTVGKSTTSDQIERAIEIISNSVRRVQQLLAASS